MKNSCCNTVQTAYKAYWIAALLVILLVAACGERTLVSDRADDTDLSADSSVNTNQVITLFEPAHRTMTTNKRPLFRWGSSRSQTWQLQIGTNTNFTHLITDTSFSSSSGSNYTPGSDLPLTEHHVYWRVIGTDETGASNCSPVYMLRQPLQNLELIISEINWNGVRANDGEGSYYGEFTEIYNPQPYPVDIGNCKLIYIKYDGSSTNTVTFPPGILLGAKSFIVTGQDYSDDNFFAAYLTSDFLYRMRDDGLRISNSGFSFELVSAEGVRIDFVNAVGTGEGGFDPIGSSDSPKSTMERVIPFADGSLAANWSVATNSANISSDHTTNTMATPGAANSVWGGTLP